MAAQQLRQWSSLDEDERDRVVTIAGTLLERHWEAARGFAIDDAMRATIAVRAALLGLGPGPVLFRNVTAIVVHPRTMVLRDERPTRIPGVVTRAPRAVQGHTSARGPVFIAWNDVRRPQGRSGRNVVLHEFAHKVDALGGMLDGTPPIDDRDLRRDWIEVCTAAYEAVQRRERPSVLRSYAGTSPAEFFAVGTEVFFERPHPLREEHPSVYQVFSAFYRQDPAAREPDPSTEA